VGFGVFVFAAPSACAQKTFDQRPVVIVGDSQHNAMVHKKIVSAIIEQEPIAVFSLGDHVEDGDDPKLWKIFNETIDPLRAVSKYYPALGNHERNSSLYYKNFGLSDKRGWYAVEENNILFIVLDSNDPLGLSTTSSEQYRWLEDVLASKGLQDEYIVVLFHHPLFTTSMSHPEDEKGWRKTALPLFEKYHVDLVFSGHCHNYERSFYKGIYFIVSGGGGSSLYDKSRESPYSQVFIKKYHFCKLVSEEKALYLTIFDIDGKVIDEIEIPSKRVLKEKKKS